MFWLMLSIREERHNLVEDLRITPNPNITHMENPIDAEVNSSNDGKYGLAVSPIAAAYLNETGKWGKFLAIVGFIVMGLIVLAGLFAGKLFATLGQTAGMPYAGLIGVFYILIAVLYFFPILYLFNFSSRIRKALQTKDNQTLDSAFENLKSHYKFMGIFMIIILGIYVVFGAIALISVMAMSR
jgi:MFS family permease